MAGDDLISTLERAGEYDALSKLRPDEPYFVLIGRDGLAPNLIDEWADRNRRRALEDFNAGRIDRERYERECRKSTQAEMAACDMRAFKNGQPAEVKDGPRTGATYSGFEASEETKRLDAIHSARVRSRAALNDAVAELAELQELDGASFNEFCTVAQCGADDLRRLSSAVEVPRVGIKK